MSLPPDVIDQLLAGSGANATEARTLVLPYDDLRILAPPERNLAVSPDLISALSVLVAQGPVKPSLLHADTVGNLLTSTRNGWVARTVTDMPAGSSQVMVDSTRQMALSDVCQLTFGTIGNQTTLGTLIIDGIFPDGTIHFENNVAQDVPIGSIVMQIPATFITSFQSPVPITPPTTFATLGAASAPNQNAFTVHDNAGIFYLAVRDAGLPLAASNGAAFIAPATPGLTFAATPAFAFVVNQWSACIGAGGGGTAQIVTVSIDEVGTGGVNLWKETIGVDAVAGRVMRAGAENCRIASRKGFGVSISFNAALAANNFASLSLGVYEA